MTNDALIAAARQSLGTRFRHQGRSARHGVDCVGLIIVAARAVGLDVKDVRAYGRQPQPAHFISYIERNALDRIDAPAPGAIALFDFGAGPQHAALLTGKSMLHAYAPSRKVVEHGFTGPWPQRLCGLYAFTHLNKTGR